MPVVKILIFLDLGEKSSFSSTQVHNSRFTGNGRSPLIYIN